MPTFSRFALFTLYVASAQRSLELPWLGANLGAAMLTDHPWANASFLAGVLQWSVQGVGLPATGPPISIALPGLSLGTIRFPAGTYGNYYNWTCGCTV